MLKLPPITSLVPHAGRMCLLETIEHWDAHSVSCGSRTHRDPLNPLRGSGGLHAVHLVEYGAQAAAVHGGLMAHAEGRTPPPGMLAALRSVRIETDRIDSLPDDLRIEARRLLADASGWVYEFTASVPGRCLASGRLTVSNPRRIPDESSSQDLHG